MGESYEFKYKLNVENNWGSITYQTYDELLKAIESFKDGYGTIENKKIKIFEDIYDYRIIKRNYDVFFEGNYYIYSDSGDRILINDIYIDIEEFENGDFKPINDDITYELSKKVGFKSKKNDELKFEEGKMLYNGKVIYSPKEYSDRLLFIELIFSKPKGEYFSIREILNVIEGKQFILLDELSKKIYNMKDKINILINKKTGLEKTFSLGKGENQGKIYRNY